MKILVIDYGMGNLWSLKNAIEYLGYMAEVSSDHRRIENADILVIPGVGSFGRAMDEIKRREINESIIEAVIGKKTKILGICLGMQLMADSSSEGGDTNGFGFINGDVCHFQELEMGRLKVPHIGFNEVTYEDSGMLFRGIPSGSNFYFVHSYRMLPGPEILSYGICNYGENFVASYQKENIFATQFHPEKSQTNGLLLLKNFICA